MEQDRSHVSELASKVRDLNQKLEEIRREQQYQREREADYRNLSEATNGRAVWYSIAQILVLVTTCAWQLRHLRVSSVHYNSVAPILTGCFSDFLRIEKYGSHHTSIVLGSYIWMHWIGRICAHKCRNFKIIIPVLRVLSFRDSLPTVWKKWI